MKILLLGQHGAGKSTQAYLLGHQLRLPVISTGGMFRQASLEHTVLGEALKQELAAGEYVPDSQVLTMVKKRLSRPDAQDGFIMEGFPRTVEQAKSSDIDFDLIIYLTLEDAEGHRRLIKRKRADDQPEVIARRFQEHHERSGAVLEYLRQHGRVIDVDANRHIDEIHGDLMHIIRAHDRN